MSDSVGSTSLSLFFEELNLQDPALSTQPIQTLQVLKHFYRTQVSSSLSDLTGLDMDEREQENIEDAEFWVCAAIRYLLLRGTPYKNLQQIGFSGRTLNIPPITDYKPQTLTEFKGSLVVLEDPTGKDFQNWLKDHRIYIVLSRSDKVLAELSTRFKAAIRFNLKSNLVIFLNESVNFDRRLPSTDNWDTFLETDSLTKDGLIQALNLRKFAYTPEVKVGIYTGTFDPFHENHFRICEFLLKSHVDYLVIVPNTCEGEEHANPWKTAHSLAHRSDWIRIRFANYTNVFVYESKSLVTGWQMRSKLADAIEAEFLRDSQSAVVTYLVIGSDSFARSCQRSSRRRRGGHRNMGILHYASDRKILIFPRLDVPLPGQRETSNLPERVSKNLSFIEGYSDALPLSSSLIRQKLETNTDISGNELYPPILEAMKDLKRRENPGNN